MDETEKAGLVTLIRKLTLPLESLPVQLGPPWEALVPRPGGEKPVLTGIKAILFDLYGTLFISGAGEIAAAPEAAAPEAGVTEPPGVNGSETAASAFNTAGAPEHAAMRLYFRQAVKERHEAARDAGKAWPEVDVEEIWAKYRGVSPGRESGITSRELALRYELAVNPVYPMPHALETLNALARRGMTLGIISNAQFFSPLLFDAFFNASPEQLGFAPDLLIYSFEEGEAKPSPRLFAEARERLARRGITAGETLYVGNDMRNDMVPAADTGFSAALFAGDRRSLRLREDDPACTGQKPLLVLKDLQSLLTGRY
jgi:putative hydrolase of the HAD superfamily